MIKDMFVGGSYRVTCQIQSKVAYCEDFSLMAMKYMLLDIYNNNNIPLQASFFVRI